MQNYTTLKHSENGMPIWDSFYGPVLQVALTKDLWKLQDLKDATIKAIALPEKLATLRYASRYHDLVADNRVGWAISDLKIAGLLDNPKRGYYKISELGKKDIEKQLNITKDYVHSLPKYVEHQKQRRQNTSDEKAENDIQSLELNPDQIKNWFDKQRDDLSSALLTKLRETDPDRFEKMMINLLSKMGYKGPDGDAWVTQKTNDGGIDGILNQDPLGLRKVLIQVKRYEEGNNVGRQTISQFHGDLDLQGADRGVFITTSSFTTGAEMAAKAFNIKLIDGDTLTKLMIDYKVGVQVQKTYELFEIDNDFFDKKDN